MSLFVAGCGGVDTLGKVEPDSCLFADYPDTIPAEPMQFRLATFWVDGQENQAFKILLTSVDTEMCTVTEIPRNSRTAQVTSIADWVADGQPLPDGFQVNGGSDLLQWVSDRDEDETQVCSLDVLRRRYDWDEKFFPMARKPLTCHGHLFGLPVGVHRLNTILFNHSLFEKLKKAAELRGMNLVVPGEIADIAGFLEQLRIVDELGSLSAKGNRVVPLALGGDTTWPLTILAFENLLAAQGGGVYEKLWQGLVDGDDSSEGSLMRGHIEQLLDDLATSVALSNAGEGHTWQDAVHAVAEGEALLTVMGDWSLAQLSAEELAAVTEVRFPGTEKLFIYTPDSFAITRVAGTDGAAAHLWLREVVANPKLQLAFSAKKFSSPTLVGLSDADLAGLPTESLRSAYREFSACQEPSESCRPLLAVSGLGPAPVSDPCFDRIGNWLALASGLSVSDPLDGVRDCELGDPKSAAEAQKTIVELLLRIASSPYAEDCR